MQGPCPFLVVLVRKNHLNVWLWCLKLPHTPTILKALHFNEQICQNPDSLVLALSFMNSDGLAAAAAAADGSITSFDENTLPRNNAGPNPTYSMRVQSEKVKNPKSNQKSPKSKSGPIGPLLKIEVLDSQKWSKSEILIFLSNFYRISSNFCFYGNVKKITFWTCFVRPKILYLPYIGWPCGGGVRSDHFWKPTFQTPKSGPKSAFSA